MKLIKKLLAVMFAFMMVIGMSSNVKAVEATRATTEKGSITINKAQSGETYTIYKILELESYDDTNNLYSYKPASETWKTFLKDNSSAQQYFQINDNGYVLWKGEENEARAGEFAKIALEYAKNKNNSEVNAASNTATSTSVVFNDLPLGYYLVDSTVGSLCGLTTTKPTVTIEEKNGAPTVTKRILPDFTTPGSKVEFNDASIGDVVTFETDIYVKKGASKYNVIKLRH